MKNLLESLRTNRTGYLASSACILLLAFGCSNSNPTTPDNNGFDLKIEMRLIPAGSFRMGNVTYYPYGESDEEPVHRVTLTRPFFMSRTEVTQEQYEAVMGVNPSIFRGEDYPVERISWYDAIAFCNALSTLEGRDTCYTGRGVNIVCDFSANGYRLPTEAEWEYACRAGTESDFHTGNISQAGEPLSDPALDMAGWYRANSNDKLQPVGMKNPNGFGLCDMHGNVSEWCWDWYGNYPASSAMDPRGPNAGIYRVHRGGSWHDSPGLCRSANRGVGYPVSKDYGFRVVRTHSP